MKIVQRIIIPNYLVPHLIKNKDNIHKISNIQKKYECLITIQSESELTIKTAQGLAGRLVTIKGEPKACSKTLYHFNEQLIKIENHLNGQKHI